MEEQLPVYKEVCGFEFWVDVEHFRLIDRSNPHNIWKVGDMFDHGTGYTVHYNAETRQMEEPYLLTEHSCTAYIPYMHRLDVEGMARRTGIDSDALENKNISDLELLLMQPDLLARTKMGKQPVLEICGHPFFVNIRAGRLEPKDNFLSRGIPFDELRWYTTEDGNGYRILYDKEKMERSSLDISRIQKASENVCFIEFPNERILDPVGYARDYGVDLRKLLMERRYVAHRTAKETPVAIVRQELEKSRRKGHNRKRGLR